MLSHLNRTTGKIFIFYSSFIYTWWFGSWSKCAHEMQFLVQAVLTPIEALRSVTSEIVSAFGLTDRGRIVEGARSDLLLVDGDPTTNISDTLSIESAWLNGSVQNNQKND